MIKKDSIYTCSNSGEWQTVRLLSEDYKYDTVVVQDVLSSIAYRLPHSSFFKNYEKVSDKPKVQKDNVNEDILNLIQSGYKFTSFFGDTDTGLSFSLEVES